MTCSQPTHMQAREGGTQMKITDSREALVKQGAQPLLWQTVAKGQ